MGLSTSKSTKKVDTKTTENATTTPTYSPGVQSGLDQFTGQNVVLFLMALTELKVQEIPLAVEVD